MDAYWAAPPVTRTLTAWCFFQSLVVHGRLLNPHRVIFHTYYLWKFPPEVWRIFTSFMLSGAGLGIIFEPYFIWQYGSALETGGSHFSTPGSFLVFIIFVGVLILLSAWNLLGAYTFTHALIMAIVWKYAQDNRGKKVHFYVIDINVKYLPGALMLLDFVISGPNSALMGLCGIFASHCHEFLTHYWPEFGGGRNLIPTPKFVIRWFQGPSGRAQVRNHGTAIRPPNEAPPPQTSSVLPPSWRSRGAGHRLGGD